MKKILFILTGGTISMQFESSGTAVLESEKSAEQILEALPTLRLLADIDVIQLFSEDSSNLSLNHWKALIQCIDSNYIHYDGFVILHGTDTMAYTASALSFGLSGLQKPVILTGSQVPLVNIRSDARRNLINAVELATMSIHEVGICFNDRLYRGNRSTKMSIGDFDAFSSPNFEALAKIGTSIILTQKYIQAEIPFSVNPHFDNSIFHIKAFPSLKINELSEFVSQSETRAIIIEAFGSGNLPVKGDYSFVPFVENCIKNEKIVVIASQAPYDTVDLSKYSNGKLMKEIGAIDTGDMTLESSITKMMHLLANESDLNQIKKRFSQNISGEITPIL